MQARCLLLTWTTMRTPDASGDLPIYSASERTADGIARVLRTDDEATFLKHLYDEHLATYGVTGVVVEVTAAGDGWHRVDVRFPMTPLDGNRRENLEGDFTEAFEVAGWYECQSTGSESGGDHVWWVVRHRDDKPWI